MSQLVKILRWYFGIEALSLIGICVTVAASSMWKAPDGDTPHLSLAGWTALATLAGAHLALITVSGMACWALCKRKPSARFWALAASFANVPLIWIGRPLWISTAAGIGGLLIFSRRDALPRPSVNTANPPRLAGDGTSWILDTIAPLAMLGGVVAAMSWWARWAETKGLPIEKSFPFLLIVLALLVSTAIHELGHVAAGWAFGMKLGAFIVGPFQWRLRSGKWGFQFRPAGFLQVGGGAALAPVSLENLSRREISILAAGSLAHLWLGTLTMLATVAAKGKFWEQYWQLLALITSFSLIGFVINLIPLRPDGGYSDGARIYQLLRGGPWADLHRASSIVASSLVSPLRPKDYDIEAIHRAAQFVRHGERALLLRLYAYLHFFDSGRISEALQAMAEAESVYEESACNVPAELHSDFIFANAFLKHDAPAARLWWNRMEAKKITRHSADYWKARSALLWIENREQEARAAWDAGNAMAQRLPKAGAYDFDRYCFAQLGQVLERA